MKKLFYLFVFLLSSHLMTAQIAGHFVAGTDGNPQIRIESNDQAELFDIEMNNDGDLRFYANGTSANQVLVLSDDGRTMTLGQDNPGITPRIYSIYDDNAPASRYGVYGWARGTTTGTRYGILGYATETTGNRYGVYGWTPSTANGHWGMYCLGNMWYTGMLTSVSDGRLKSNVRDVENGLNEVMKLKPRSYTYKADHFKNMPLSHGTQMGFVAQEMEKVMPELVSTDMHDVPAIPGEETGEKIEVKGINYIGLIPVLTKALQEQQEIIERLESTIKEMNQRIASLEK